MHNSIVKVGPTFNESEEDDPTAQIHEQIVTEVTSDGRIIEKKIVTYPGEETTEIEEIEEVDGQTMSVKRTVVGSEKKAVQPKPRTLAEIKNEPVVLVPGYRTVEIDEKTNTTTVTEKTTTGYQQTITILQEDGTKKTQTKTFYDPVEIPGEEEEEETYEEFETFEPATEKTTVKTITEAKDAVDCSVSKKDTEPKITEIKSKVDEQSATVTEVSDSATSAKQTEVQQTQEQCSQKVKQQEETKDTKEEKDTTVTTSDVKGLQLVLAAPAGPASLTQKKTTTEGKEIEVTTTVSEDGKTKTLRKTVRQPSEEIEIEETEETESYEPGEVTVITTNKTIPLVDALEDAAKDIVDASKTVVDAKNKADATKIIAQQGNTSETSTTEVQEQLKSKIKVSAKQTTTAKQTVTPSKKTTEAKQTTTEAKQATTEAKRTTTEAKQTPTEAKQSTTSTTAKEALTSAKQTTTEAKQTTIQAVTPGKPSVIKKDTKQDQTDASVKKTTNTKTNEKDTKNTVQPTTGKATTTSKKDESQTKSKTTADVTKKESPVKSDKTATKTSTSTDVATIGKPKVTTKNGETTTEVVRSIPGGTEHTLTTVKADGTKKVEIKKYFDVVEFSGSEEEEEIEEYEEYEEVEEDETPPVKSTTTKIQTTTGAVGAKGKK